MTTPSVPTSPPAARKPWLVALIVISVLALCVGVPMFAWLSSQRVSAVEQVVSTETVAPVATAPVSDDVPAPAPEVVLPTFTVNSERNTLYGIASRTCGKGSRWSEIAKLNNVQNKIIHVGQKLNLPVDCTQSIAPIKVKTAPTTVETVPPKAESVKVAKSVAAEHTPAAKPTPDADPAPVASEPRSVTTTNNVVDCTKGMPDGKVASDMWIARCGKVAFKDTEEFVFDPVATSTPTVIPVASAPVPAAPRSTLVLVADPVFECTTDDPSIGA